MTTDNALYFAYGSNMYSPRLCERVPSAEFVDVAHVPGYMMVFRKRGRDGSGKCDLEPLENATTWGVVYRLSRDDLSALDEAEGEGYRRTDLLVTTPEGFLETVTYRAKADWIVDDRPYEWYLALVLAGAREHELPPAYVAGLEQTDTRPDPDKERAARNRP